MKKYLLILVLTVLFNYSHAQDSDKIRLSKANQELLNSLEQQEEARVTRVQNYLTNNPEFKATIKDGINITHIYDIINGKPVYKSTDNLNAARGTKTTHLQPGGSLGLNLDGDGMTVGVWDGGPAENTHPEFSNESGGGSRVTIIDNIVVDGDTGFSSHGTHVSGTISANGLTNADAMGMAPKVNVKSYNWSNDEAEIVLAINDANSPIVVSNHSYGVPIDQNGTLLPSWFMGAYTNDARDIDNIAHNNPQYLMVASAGNGGQQGYPDGMYAGYDKLTTDKNAKNNLVIANANPQLTPFNYNISILTINSSSSQGPTDDLRIKPDLAADGTNLLSTVPTNNYAIFSGTSMAAPNTTGTLVLLQQYYNQLHGSYMNSSTLRGLVCHTSIDDAATIGPDPVFGWGFLDAKASAETIAGGMNGSAVLDELTLDDGQTYSVTFSAQAGQRLSASICWTDLPGAVTANDDLNNPDPKLVNDLDLRLTKDGTTFLPWKLDFNPSSGFSNSKADNAVDNIERVDIDVPTSGVYTLTVTNKGTLQGNVGGPFDPQSQDFSLIVTGNNLTLSVDDFELSESLVVFPNPNNGEFEISFNANLSNNEDVIVNVYDLHGRSVYQNTFVNTSAVFNETINLNGVQSGIYFANISKGNSNTIRKIIID